ncbi:IucA/IucC family protein [Spirilliplanes yamanashiensis]|uniref:Iron transporter n=1 Tax=Spirilliplanes yamanashiensis TaxID=42233 RepID=A0A8J3YA06_9ACTN|nr:IucA/IucC family siderophore biosynthesis protein [Spirilliplanes yamanashiensis]MDP9817932.1 hypothetical protein [Spirilliplanes yamanashiensis]GIJ04741.1 iron transporter [Spirilliplanes yamanashiensis]
MPTTGAAALTPQPPPGAAAPHPAAAPDAAATRAHLARHRPDLLGRYDAALPGARAAVLTRLWGALGREPVPGLTGRRTRDGRLTVELGGHTVAGPAAAARPHAAPVTAVETDRRQQDDPAALARTLGLGAAFAAELANSVANLALARAGAAAPPTLAELHALGPVAALARAEQAVVDGHPLHPCCRTRLGLTTADVLAHAPEHGAVVTPELLRVPGAHWRGPGPPEFPAHPWQAGRLRQAYPWVETVTTLGPARALMSLRTLAPLDGGPHLKTAVDVQMTSAVRTVSPAAVANGPRLSALLGRLTRDLPVTVLAETGGAGVPDRRFGFVRRAAPALGPGEIAVPLAVFAAAPPLLRDVAGADPRAWVRALTGLLGAFGTLLDRGVACEGHGQNVLVVLRGARPVRLLYRDLGGVRVSPARLRAHGEDPPPLDGDLTSDDPGELRTTLAAALGGNALGEHLAALARHTDPAPLHAETDRLGLPPVVKATTAMRLAADPLTPQWAPAA